MHTLKILTILSISMISQNEAISLTYYSGSIDSTQHTQFPLNNLTTLILFESLDKLDYNSIPFYKKSGVKQIHYMATDGHRTEVESEAQKNVTIDRFKFKDPSYREEKINFWTDFILKNNFTGINLDFELSMYKNSDRKALTKFVEELYTRFNALNLEVTFAVPYHPFPLGCFSGRCYDWYEMSKFVDYFVVMAYDTQFIPFFAETTCSQSQVYSGLKKYLSMGVPESKLVITLPWYFPVSRCVFRFYGECVTWILSLNYKTQACQSALYNQNEFNASRINAKFDNPTGSFYSDLISEPLYGMPAGDKRVNFDNSTSLRKKIRKFGELGNFGGYGSFRAGCMDEADPDFDEMWKLIQSSEKFDKTEEVGDCKTFCRTSDYEILYVTICSVVLILISIGFFKCFCFDRFRLKKGGGKNNDGYTP